MSARTERAPSLFLIIKLTNSNDKHLIFQSLKNLKTYNESLNLCYAALLKLYYALIHSHLNYGILEWGNTYHSYNIFLN